MAVKCPNVEDLIQRLSHTQLKHINKNFNHVYECDALRTKILSMYPHLYTDTNRKGDGRIDTLIYEFIEKLPTLPPYLYKRPPLPDWPQSGFQIHCYEAIKIMYKYVEEHILGGNLAKSSSIETIWQIVNIFRHYIDTPNTLAGIDIDDIDEFIYDFLTLLVYSIDQRTVKNKYDRGLTPKEKQELKYTFHVFISLITIAIQVQVPDL